MDLPAPDAEFFDKILVPWATPLMQYHRYSLIGAERLPRTGPVLLISTHSMITYDLFFAFIELRRQTGRFVRSLADDFWFRTRTVGKTFERCGLVRASPQAGRVLLEQGELLGVSPGGQWEALRPSTERHRLRWEGRRGFSRLALMTRVPLALVTCPAADRVMTVYSSPLTDWVYRRFGSPLPLVRGLGPTLIPRPIRLTTYVSPVFYPPNITSQSPTDIQIEQFREEVQTRMEAFMAEALHHDGA